MDRSLIKSMMPSLVAGHVPRNVRSFKYRVFDDQPLSSTLGFAIDPQPFDGKVVAATDDAIVVKLKPSEFAVLDPSLVTTVPAEGAKVHVQPYARRRFDGLRADTPEVITEETSDGTPYTSTRHILGSAPAKLPIPTPQCMELGQLIEQLEEMPAPDRFRRITHNAGGCRCPRLHLGRSHALQDHRDPAGDQLHGLDREVRGPGDDPLRPRRRHLRGGTAPSER